MNTNPNPCPYENKFEKIFNKEYLRPSGLSLGQLANQIRLTETYLKKNIQNGRTMSRTVSAKLGGFFGKPDMFFFELQDALDAPYRTVVVSLHTEEIERLITALDIYSRIWMGQYDYLSFETRFRLGNDVDWHDVEVKEKNRNALLRRMRDIILPELAGRGLGASHGIWSDQVNPLASDAYDIQQVIRFTDAYYRHPEGGVTVRFREPLIQGRNPRPVAKMSGPRERPVMRLELAKAQGDICADALEINQHFRKGEYRALFSFYTNNQEALGLAEECELYNVHDAMHTEDLGSFLSKVKSAVQEAAAIT